MAQPLLHGLSSAFITGAAMGIGQHTAIAFARHGIKRLAIADFNKESLAKAHASLQADFPTLEILPLHIDVRNKAQVKDGISETVKAFGRLDVAVNNAGVGGTGGLTHETADEEIDRILDTNFHGVYRCQKEQLSVMVKQEDLGQKLGRGRIINVASMFGIVAPNPRLSHTAYTAAKHGVIGLTKADANAYGSFNIRINAIAPGFVETPLNSAHHGEVLDPDSPLQLELNRCALQRISTMEEIGEAIALMASPINSYMQGAVQVVDGGLTSC